MYVIANPDVDAVFVDEFAAGWVFFEMGAFEIGPETGIARGFGLVLKA
jgi:hypothetical protein